MNGPSETATLAPTVQSNGVLFSPYYSHFPSNGHYHFYPNNNGYPGEPIISANGNDDVHVTVLQIDQNQPQHQRQSQQHQFANHHVGNNGVMNPNIHPQILHANDLNSDFVTVLKIVSTGATILTNTSTTTTASQITMNGSHNQRVFVDNKRGEIEEEVTIYRLPGERLGMALRFDGGQSANETIRRVFVQNITLNSPSSKAIGLMLGMLREGDEILQIDGRASCSLTRLECITLLRDAPVCIRLFVRRSLSGSNGTNQSYVGLNQSYQFNPTCPSHQLVPNVSNCCQMPIHLPNNNHNLNNDQNHSEMQNHCMNSSSHSSSTTSLISPTNTPLLTQLLSSCTSEPISIPKKVPPPVPPRMATTTLSSRRKPRPTPIPPNETNMERMNNIEQIVKNNNQSSEPAVKQQNGIEQTSTSSPVVQVEKPPRRKNLHNNNGNPPPLPPRRPKGPPPKPPTDRVTQSTSIVNVNVASSVSHTNSNDNIITTSAVTKSLPSLVTVISSKTFTTDVTDSISTSTSVIHERPHSDNISSGICSTTPSSSCPSICTATTTPLTITKTTLSTSTTNIHPSKTTKVTFNISNSKVSSFIRQTAEKLHRKLSGKTTSQSESDDENNSVNNTSSKTCKDIARKSEEKEIHLTSNCNNNDTLLNKSDNEKSSASVLSSSDQSPQPSSPPTPASYADFSQDIEESFESDTDDTSSSVSTIIERGPFTNGFVPQLEHNLNQSILSSEKSDIDDMSIVDRVLSPFEKLDNEMDNETTLASVCLPSSTLTLTTVTSNTMADSLHIDLPLPSLALNNEQLSSDKTMVLIRDDDQLKAQTTPVEPPNSIGNDTDFRRDQLGANNINELTDSKRQMPIEVQSNNKNEDKNVNLAVVNSDDDDEDLDAIKNDIFSRLDDDKDDFMIDTDYLNESSSRFLFHHNSSELILNTYSELSSITEEDEEEDVSEFKLIESIVADKSVGKSIEPVKVIETQNVNIINGNHVPNNLDKVNGQEPTEDNPQPVQGEEQSQKVSLNNVFEFLNKAADDFEFVERMLELTNDKIDSIDDIMRIRESLRGLQESDQRQSLQRFLDGKDVFEELIALSSSASSSSSTISSSCSSHSSASSPDNEYPANVIKSTNDCIDKRSNLLPTNTVCHQTNSQHDFTSLPVCLANKPPIAPKCNLIQESPILKSTKIDQAIESKIPTLLPKPTTLSTSNLNKRSKSISNIFTRSNGYNSLIETRPSLIPRPISNFNLSLPSNNIKNSLSQNQQPTTTTKTHRTSHSCLNRSTSMQSIFSTNSLPRSQWNNNNKQNKTMLPRRQSSVTSSSSTNSNYHHNCLKNQDHSLSPYHYGSLSRNVSKSSTNVYNTGSLPRPSTKTVQVSGVGHITRTNSFMSNNGQFDTVSDHGSSNHHQDFRTTSLTDLTYGLVSNSGPTSVSSNSNINNRFSSSQATVSHLNKTFNNSYHHHHYNNHHSSKSSSHHSIGNGNLLRSDSLNSSSSFANNPFVQQQRNSDKANLELLEYPNTGFSTLGHQKKSSLKQQSSTPYLRTSASLASLPTGEINNNSQSLHNSHFWHCSNHSYHSSSILKRNGTSGHLSSSKNRPNTTTNHLTNVNGNKPLKSSIRKTESKSNCSSSSSSSSSNKSDSEEHQIATQPQSILRTSSKTNKTNSGIQQKDNKNYWSQGKTKSDFELSSSHSDSEGSDITISSGDSAEYLTSKTLKEIWPEKRQQNNNNSQHRVCFMDQIDEHGLNATNANNEQSTINGDMSIEQTEQKLAKIDEHPYSSSPEVAVLSSSTSTSSISSLGSAGDVPKTKKVNFEEHRSKDGMSHGKSYFLANNPHREDSGIFASDDTSTSEFSQSPSPDLIRGNHSEKVHEEKNCESIQSIKPKPMAFSDAESTSEQQDSNESTKQSTNVTSNQILSRSCSAPFETVCESVKQMTNKNDMKRIEQNSYMIRDSFITARRQQNFSKLKGLVIPELDDVPDKVDVVKTTEIKPEIDLPTIISEDILKIKDLEKFDSNCKQELNNKLNDNIQPIEIIPLKPANVSVPKYSPMFKRRTFSLPSNNDNNTKTEETKNEQQTTVGSPVPIVPPKPKTKTFKTKMSTPPPLPPKSKEINMNIINGQINEANNQSSIVVMQESNEQGNETGRQDEPKKIMNEFVIYQKQHSMRAIIFHLNDLSLNDEKEYLSYLGFTIKGGFDSESDNVTVENIQPDGLAARDGRLKKGDRIISINGKRLAGMTHNKILDLLKTSCLSEKVVLVCTRAHEKSDDEMLLNNAASLSASSTASVSNNNFDDSNVDTSIVQSNTDANNNNFKLIRADITKDVTGLGFIIEGGKNSSFGDRPITIKRIFRGGPVDKEGTLMEGDELLFVNDHPVEEMTRAEAWNFLKQIPDGKVSLVVRRRKQYL